MYPNFDVIRTGNSFTKNREISGAEQPMLCALHFQKSA
jgi:hypothetical protein